MKSSQCTAFGVCVCLGLCASSCSTASGAMRAVVAVQVSGEAAATGGFAWTPTPGDEPSFVDGWELSFEHAIVVVAKVRLNRQGNDPSARASVGTLIEEQVGPWIVDLARGGSVVGVGGADERAAPLTTLGMTTTLDTQSTYAFSYEVGPATAASRNVNVAPSDQSLIDEMVRRGWTNYYAGVATYRGREPSASVDTTFTAYPKTVRFAFGMAHPTAYVNCHNPELGADEDNAANWGVRPNASTPVTAQLTFHLDHLFWDQLDVEGAALRFDPIAARATGFGTAMDPLAVSLDDLATVLPGSLRDRSGAPVGDRGQTTGYTANAGAPPSLVTGSASGVADLRDFVSYSDRSNGHLNSDGLCLVVPLGPISY